MRIVLSVVGALSWVLGLVIIFGVRAVFQETVGVLLLVNGTVALSASAIIEEIRARRAAS